MDKALQAASDLGRHHGKPPMKVDVRNNFHGLGADGRYHSIPDSQITLVPKISQTHVKTYIFAVDAMVEVIKCDHVREVHAKAGDMLIIWSDGDHKVVPPEAQKWLIDVVPTPTKVG